MWQIKHLCGNTYVDNIIYKITKLIILWKNIFRNNNKLKIAVISRICFTLIWVWKKNKTNVYHFFIRFLAVSMCSPIQTHISLIHSPSSSTITIQNSLSLLSCFPPPTLSSSSSLAYTRLQLHLLLPIFLKKKTTSIQIRNQFFIYFSHSFLFP